MKEVCELLISLMSLEAINALNKYGNTALTLAASKGMKEVCELLIPLMTQEAINAADNYDRTTLYFAAKGGHKEVCELLIPLMSPEAINAVTIDGYTALTWAAEKGIKEVCELLIPLMSPEAINAVTQNGKTALTWAAWKGMKEVCEVLIPLITQEAINAVTTGYYDKGTALYQDIIKFIDNSFIRQVVVDLLQDKFAAALPPIEQIEDNIKLLCMYQYIVNQNTNFCLNELQEKVNSYIDANYLRLIRICKYKQVTAEHQEKQPSILLDLPQEILQVILSYLKPCSLLPELLEPDNDLPTSFELLTEGQPDTLTQIDLAGTGNALNEYGTIVI
jgi:hypothetical protein